MTFAERVKGVLVLDVKTFEEIEADRTANGQALLVVVAASVAAGLGAGVSLGTMGLLRETLGALIGWVMWAVVTWAIGAKLLPEPQTRTDIGELLRVIGYAYAPQLFAFFVFLPILGGVVSTVVGVLAPCRHDSRRASGPRLRQHAESRRGGPDRLVDLRRHSVGLVGENGPSFCHVRESLSHSPGIP